MCPEPTDRTQTPGTASLGAVGLYRVHVLPRVVDHICGQGDFRSWRSDVVAGLSGTVVEIGFGSGLNVPHYPDEVELVYAVEPSLAARRMSSDRVADSEVAVRHIGLDGQRLPLGDDSCDGALSTFTLCTIPDVEEALRELRRVIRPGGSFHFLEHGRSPERSVARLQGWFDPVQKTLGDGCHLTRDPVALVEASGMAITRHRSQYGTLPKLWNWLTIGTARVP